MAGLIIPRKCALNLTAQTDIDTVAASIHWASTVEPPFAQRKLKYRNAPGIGAYDVQQLDPRTAQQLHSAAEQPGAAHRVVLARNEYIDVLLFKNQNSVQAWFRSLSEQDRSYNQVVASFPWVDALGSRTSESLSNASVLNSVENISLRSW
ncbi:hypothetical protein [Nocardia salmonicida]|uniref:hypothetical protein n=1 Tax=Nocardia salmonicida TaxID=53431 RepID=UPI003CECC188